LISSSLIPPPFFRQPSLADATPLLPLIFASDFRLAFFDGFPRLIRHISPPRCFPICAASRCHAVALFRHAYARYASATQRASDATLPLRQLMPRARLLMLARAPSDFPPMPFSAATITSLIDALRSSIFSLPAIFDIFLAH
jgi:hypothetical protein